MTNEEAADGEPGDISERAADLLARCALRDHSAFAELYRMTSGKLYGLVLRIVRDEQLAKDVLQDGFVRIWSHAADYRPDKAAPITWMGSIVRNRAIDLLRRRRVQPVSETPVEQLTALQDETRVAPDLAVLHGQRDQALYDCMQRLNSAQRQAITLAYYRGLTHEEMAVYTDTPLGTVKSWLRRGLLRLKECLEEQ